MIHSQCHPQEWAHSWESALNHCLCIHLRLQQSHILLWHWGWTCAAAVWLKVCSSLKCRHATTDDRLTLTSWALSNMVKIWHISTCRLYLHRITSWVISWAYTWQVRPTKCPWWWFWMWAPGLLPRLVLQIWWVFGAHTRLNGFARNGITHPGSHCRKSVRTEIDIYVKLTWLVLGEDPAARSHRVEQFTALWGL